MRTWLVAVAIAVAFAGCTEGSVSNGVDSGGAGQEASADGRVFFNGYRNTGFAETDEFQCDADARIQGFINGAGEVTIDVKDAAGATKASMSVRGSGQDAVDSNVDGSAGTWTITVEVDMFTSNGQGFSGQYGVDVYC